jgi:signal transduction histidine kinase
VLVFDANQQVMIANPAANQLANQDLQSSTLSQLLATLDEKAREVVKTWVQGQKPADQNNVKFDWYQRTISATIAPVPLATDDGRRVGAGNVMVLRDFTKEAELERAKNLFLGMVSHELRTPMSAIKGYVNILLNIEKEHLSDTGYEYLQTIDVSIVQLLSLANELIDLSRIEMGEIELYREWVDLTPIVKQAAKMVQQEFASRNLSLEIKLADSLPKLYVDRNRMLQVLLNLLSNAYKYTPKGGATLEISQAEDRVYIAVTDTGVGIKPADKARMFSRFFRADDHVVQRAGGTGLGLNITKGLVELHGGELTFSSEYGVGTTFQVAIPQNGQVPAEDEKQILDLQPSLE